MSPNGDAPAARTLNLLCAGAVKGLVAALRERFLAASCAGVGGRFGAVGAMREALLAGAPCDVMIVTEAMLRELRDEGAVAALPFAPIGRVRTGVAARAGEPLPRIDSSAALATALRAAPAIYLPDIEQSTAGRHIALVLARLGIADETCSRLAVFPNGATAMAALAESGPPGALGCTQVTEILYTPRLTLAGALPEPFGLSTVYAAGVGRAASEPALAAAFIALLCGDAAAAERQAGGFEPATDS
jgi:molybdate transport system substrate-binding protein